MKKAFLVGLLVVVLLAIGLILKMKTEDVQDAKRPVTIEDLREIVKDGRPTNEYFRALVKLAQKGDDQARESAQEVASSKDQLHRLAAAEALGHIEGESAATTLEMLAKDEDSNVRIRALGAFGHRKGADRERRLIPLIQKQKLSESEKIHAWASLLRIASVDKNKALAADHLIYLMKHAKSKNDRAMAANHLIHMGSDYPGVEEALIEQVTLKTTPVVVANSIIYLSRMRRPWIKKRLPRLAQDDSEIIRKAAIQSLHLACPDERWEIFNNVFSQEGSKSVRLEALKELEFHAPAEVAGLLKELQDLGKVLSYESSRVEEIHKKINEAPWRDRCQ